MTYHRMHLVLSAAQKAKLIEGGAIHLDPLQVLPATLPLGDSVHVDTSTHDCLVKALREQARDVVMQLSDGALKHNLESKGSFAWVDPMHWYKVYARFPRGAGARLMAGKGVRLHAVDDVSTSQKDGYHMTWLSHAQHEKMSKARAKGQSWTYRPSHADCLHNAVHGGGWGDFTDFLGRAVDVVADVGKKALDITSTYILPIVSAALEVLPSSDPRILALKSALKVVGNLATTLNQAVNKKQQAEERVEQASAQVAEAEEDVFDKEQAAKAKGLSDSVKAAARRAADAARERLKKKKAEVKEASKRASAEAKRVAGLERDRHAALIKQKRAEEKVVAAAAKLKK